MVILFLFTLSLLLLPLPLDWVALIPSEFGTLKFFINIFTHQITHGNLRHLMGNYMFMIPYALFLEHKLGRLKFTLFYFACGILAAASQVLGDAPGGMIGSSGAAFGVFAGACAMFDRTFVERCLAFLLLGLAVMQQFEMATSDFGASVAYWAHFGGALGGLALVHFFVKPYLQSQSTSVEPRK